MEEPRLEKGTRLSRRPRDGSICSPGDSLPGQASPRVPPPRQLADLASLVQTVHCACSSTLGSLSGALNASQSHFEHASPFMYLVWSVRGRAPPPQSCLEKVKLIL